jgi:hypothetical protein
MEESTEYQKKQYRKQEFPAQKAVMKKIKIKAKQQQAQTGEEEESEFKREPIEFDPIHGLGKAMKDRYDDLEVYANGKEVEE